MAILAQKYSFFSGIAGKIGAYLPGCRIFTSSLF
jgi:hypothetical protein